MLIEKIKTWFESNGLNLVLSAAALVVGLVIILLLKIISIRIRKKVDERAQNITIFIYTILKYAILILSLFIILSIWEFESIIAYIIFAICVAIFGIACIPLIIDLYYGISNIFSAEYKVGDYIEIKGFIGKVVNFTLIKTKVQSINGETRTFANSLFKEFTNYSQNYYTAVVTLDITELDRLEEIKSIIEETLPKINDEYKDIIEGPNLTGIEKFSKGVVTLKIVAKVKYEDYNKIMKGLQEYLLDITVKYDIK